MKKQKGVTLLESILVLSLISIITIGSLSLFKSASDNANARSATSELHLLAINLRSFMERFPPTDGKAELWYGYGGRDIYTAKQLILLGLIPRGMVKETGGNAEIKTALGGKIQIFRATGYGDGTSGDAIVGINYYDNGNKSVCAKIVSKLNAGYIWDGTGGTNYTKLPVKLDVILEQVCRREKSESGQGAAGFIPFMF